jgi:hypothetical protein
MQEVAQMGHNSTALVDVEALGAYAKEQLDLGDQAADEAAEPYRFRAIDALDKARPSVRARGDETVEEYEARVTNRASGTIRAWRRARDNKLQLIEDARTTRKSGGASPLPTSIRGLTGQSQTGQSHMRREWTPEVDAQAKHAFREQVEKTIETRAQEATAEKALAKRLIDIGYKVLAKELHPDAGGNREAMQRLSEVKRRLYRAFNL